MSNSYLSKSVRAVLNSRYSSYNLHDELYDRSIFGTLSQITDYSSFMITCDLLGIDVNYITEDIFYRLQDNKAIWTLSCLSIASRKNDDSIRNSEAYIDSLPNK